MSQLPDFLPFPKEFQFGTSVSSFQVEGNSGVRKSDWDLFLAEHPGIIKPHEIGPQWWQRGKAEADLDIMSSLGMHVQRLSFEWARIEPEEGKINHDALRRYREIIDHLHKKQITPVVTLNHYTLPLWITKKGSWENSKIVSAFKNYVTLIAHEFGDIKTWLTLNEPGMLIELGYFLPIFPPQHVGIRSALRARKNMIDAHKEAYKVLKRVIPNSLVSMAFSFRWYRPENPNDVLEKLYANWIDQLDSLNYIDEVKDTIDFIGCNFYTGYFLNFNINLFKLRFRLHRITDSPPKTILFGELRKPGAYVSDIGMPIVPGFFLELLRVLHKRYNKPIIITENGIADRKDHHRAFYHLVHLVALWRAIQEGIAIKQYLVWSTVDNLEWAQGYRQQFGLIHIDPVSGERTIRESAFCYRDIVKAQGIHVQKLLSKYFQKEQAEKVQTLVRHLLNRHEKNALKMLTIGKE